MGRQHCLGYPQEKENYSGMHLSSLTHLLDLVFSFQEHNNATSCISPAWSLTVFCRNRPSPRDVWHFHQVLCSLGSTCRTVSGEFVAVSDVKTTYQQGLASGSWTTHVHFQTQVQLQTFQCSQGYKAISAFHNLLDDEHNICATCGGKGTAKGKLTVVTQKALPLLSPAKL